MWETCWREDRIKPGGNLGALAIIQTHKNDNVSHVGGGENRTFHIFLKAV